LDTQPKEKKKLALHIKTLEVKVAPCDGDTCLVTSTNACTDVNCDPGCGYTGYGHAKVASVAYF
jgi:hypothetical protein